MWRDPHSARRAALNLEPGDLYTTITVLGFRNKQKIVKTCGMTCPLPNVLPWSVCPEPRPWCPVHNMHTILGFGV